MNNRKFTTSEKEKQFYSTLKNRVHSALNGTNFKRGKADFWSKGLLWVFISYGAYFLLLLTDSCWLFWLAFLIFQLCGLLIGFSFGHDASHNTAV